MMASENNLTEFISKWKFVTEFASDLLPPVNLLEMKLL